MYKLVSALSFFFFIYFPNAFCQTKAITDQGEEVILNKDGTWKYVSIKPAYATRLDTPEYKKNAKASFLLKGKKINYGIYTLTLKRGNLSLLRIKT